MKIIKSGNFPKEVELMCKRCGCVFIAEKNDIENVGNQYINNKIISIGSVNCPECDYQIRFDINPDKGG